MKKTRRTGQVGDMLRSEISMILLRDLGDPSLGLVTVTAVEVSTDLRNANVLVSSFGNAKQKKEAIEKLAMLRGRIRHLLAGRTQLRHTPELRFEMDETAQEASSIELLIQKVRREDDEHSSEREKETNDERTE